MTFKLKNAIISLNTERSEAVKKKHRQHRLLYGHIEHRLLKKDKNMANYAKEAFTSPKGYFGTAHIERPNKKGKLKAIIVVPKDEAKEAMAHIDKFWTDNRPKGSKARPAHRGYMEGTDKETGELTGEILFIFKTNPEFPSGDKKIVKVFTAKKPIKEVKLNGVQIGRDSLGRAIGTLAIYEYDGDYGVSLFLDAISISKLVKYTGGVDIDAIDEDDEAEDVDLSMEEVNAEDGIEEETTETPRV